MTIKRKKPTTLDMMRGATKRPRMTVSQVLKAIGITWSDEEAKSILESVFGKDEKTEADQRVQRTLQSIADDPLVRPLKDAGRLSIHVISEEGMRPFQPQKKTEAKKPKESAIDYKGFVKRTLKRFFKDDPVYRLEHGDFHVNVFDLGGGKFMAALGHLPIITNHFESEQAVIAWAENQFSQAVQQALSPHGMNPPNAESPTPFYLNSRLKNAGAVRIEGVSAGEKIDLFYSPKDLEHDEDVVFKYTKNILNQEQKNTIIARDPKRASDRYGAVNYPFTEASPSDPLKPVVLKGLSLTVELSDGVVIVYDNKGATPQTWKYEDRSKASKYEKEHKELLKRSKVFKKESEKAKKERKEAKEATKALARAAEDPRRLWSDDSPLYLDYRRFVVDPLQHNPFILNALKNTPSTARIEHDRQWSAIFPSLLQYNTELYKLLSIEETAKIAKDVSWEKILLYSQSMQKKNIEDFERGEKRGKIAQCLGIKYAKEDPQFTEDTTPDFAFGFLMGTEKAERRKEGFEKKRTLTSTSEIAETTYYKDGFTRGIQAKKEGLALDARKDPHMGRLLEEEHYFTQEEAACWLYIKGWEAGWKKEDAKPSDDQTKKAEKPSKHKKDKPAHDAKEGKPSKKDDEPSKPSTEIALARHLDSGGERLAQRSLSEFEWYESFLAFREGEMPPSQMLNEHIQRGGVVIHKFHQHNEQPIYGEMSAFIRGFFDKKTSKEEYTIKEVELSADQLFDRDGKIFVGKIKHKRLPKNGEAEDSIGHQTSKMYHEIGTTYKDVGYMTATAKTSTTIWFPDGKRITFDCMESVPKTYQDQHQKMPDKYKKRLRHYLEKVEKNKKEKVNYRGFVYTGEADGTISLTGLAPRFDVKITPKGKLYIVAAPRIQTTVDTLQDAVDWAYNQWRHEKYRAEMQDLKLRGFDRKRTSEKQVENIYTHFLLHRETSGGKSFTVEVVVREDRGVVVQLRDRGGESIVVKTLQEAVDWAFAKFNEKEAQETQSVKALPPKREVKKAEPEREAAQPAQASPYNPLFEPIFLRLHYKEFDEKAIIPKREDGLILNLQDIKRAAPPASIAEAILKKKPPMVLENALVFQDAESATLAAIELTKLNKKTPEDLVAARKKEEQENLARKKRKPTKQTEAFEFFLEENKDKIEALRFFFYPAPFDHRNRGMLSFNDLVDLDQAVQNTGGSSLDKLWTAYASEKANREGLPLRLTDYIPLIRCALGIDKSLDKTFVEMTKDRFKRWHNRIAQRILKHGGHLYDESERIFLQAVVDEISSKLRVTLADLIKPKGRFANKGGIDAFADAFSRRITWSEGTNPNPDDVAHILKGMNIAFGYPYLPDLLLGEQMATRFYHYLPAALADASAETKKAILANYHNLETLALLLQDTAGNYLFADWRGHPGKEGVVKNHFYSLLNNDKKATEALFQFFKDEFPANAQAISI